MAHAHTTWCLRGLIDSQVINEAKRFYQYFHVRRSWSSRQCLWDNSIKYEWWKYKGRPLHVTLHCCRCNTGRKPWCIPSTSVFWRWYNNYWKASTHESRNSPYSAWQKKQNDDFINSTASTKRDFVLPSSGIKLRNLHILGQAPATGQWADQGQLRVFWSMCNVTSNRSSSELVGKSQVLP